MLLNLVRTYASATAVAGAALEETAAVPSLAVGSPSFLSILGVPRLGICTATPMSATRLATTCKFSLLHITFTDASPRPRQQVTSNFSWPLLLLLLLSPPVVLVGSGVTAMKAPALMAKIAAAVEGCRPASWQEPVSSRSTSRAKSSGVKMT